MSVHDNVVMRLTHFEGRVGETLPRLGDMSTHFFSFCGDHLNRV